jgi:hypothetical protein
MFLSDKMSEKGRELKHWLLNALSTQKVSALAKQQQQNEAILLAKVASAYGSIQSLQNILLWSSSLFKYYTHCQHCN